MSGVRLVLQFKCDSVEVAGAQLARMAEHCRVSRQEPGCIQFDLYRSVLRPEELVVLEHWDSEASLEAHRQAHPPGPGPRPAGITRVRETYQYLES